jgi:sterol desaturase/sphingolipid hydroxylase (fatty acid hydroxylase superfamily)
LYIPAVGRFDSIVNDIIPTFSIVIFSILLLVRVLWQKRRLRQRIQWRNYRKMAIQLLSIASLYFFIDFPPMILYAMYTSGVSLSYNDFDYYGSSLYFTAHIIMLIPLVTAFSLPELREKLKMNVLFWRRPARAVVPETIGMRRTVIEGPIAVARIVK